MFLSRNKKIMYTPCKLQFHYIKVGFKGVKIIQASFRDEHLGEVILSIRSRYSSNNVFMTWKTKPLLHSYIHNSSRRHSSFFFTFSHFVSENKAEYSRWFIWNSNLIFAFWDAFITVSSCSILWSFYLLLLLNICNFVTRMYVFIADDSCHVF